MSLLNGFGGKVTDTANFLKNPFSTTVEPPFDGNDFPDGFYIEEILENGLPGETIRLFGNMMPKIPFTFGGGQRMKKDFYSGYSEPVMQVFGSQEDDLTITGELKDKRYNRDLKGVSSDIQQLLDGIRLRGNLVRIVLGEFERYAIMSQTKFDMDKLSRIQYSITFSVIGFNAPTNARFLQRSREVPFDINRELIQQALDFQEFNKNYPEEIPRSIADKINEITGTVAGAIATVTDFIDGLTAAGDILRSINRAKGLIRYTQGKLKTYKETLGSFNPFNESQSAVGKYKSSKFYSSGIANAVALTSLLERLRAQLKNVIPNTPLGRHLVINGDNLQKISVKFYGTADNWKKLYDYNNLSSTELRVGSVLEIPRL